MTGGHLTGGHLTEEELSSHLDGVATASSASGTSTRLHLAECDSCRQRLATLEAVRSLVRTPVLPVDRDVRAASIATVLRNVATGDGGIGTGDAGTGTDDADRTVPIAIPRRRPQVLVGAAAAVLVVAAAVGVPVALSSHTASTNSASAPSSAGANTSSQSQRQNSAPGTSGFAQSVAGSVSDLGALDSVDALRSRVDALFPSASSATTSAQLPAGAAPTPSTTAPVATTQATGQGSGLGTATVPGKQNEFNIAAGTATTAQFERCLPAALRAANPTTTLHGLATATFRGTPALVYVFQSPIGGSTTGNGSGTQVVVTALAGCKVLASTSM